MMIKTLRKRHNFQYMSKNGKPIHKTGFLLQYSRMMTPTGASLERHQPLMYVGFTASRFVGGAVQRNLAKRRMRVLVRDYLPKFGIAGMHYVMVARYKIFDCDFQKLTQEFIEALQFVAENPDLEKSAKDKEFSVSRKTRRKARKALKQRKTQKRG